MTLQVELWDNAYDFINYGTPWYMKLSWYLFNRPFYRRITTLSKNHQLFARGFYDRFHDKVVLCVRDLTISTIDSIRGKSDSPFHFNFALQAYFTLVHELLHKANVAKDDIAGGHRIDFDKFEKLPEALKDIFDGLLQLENSDDSFTNHPDNRRPE